MQKMELVQDSEVKVEVTGEGKEDSGLESVDQIEAVKERERDCRTETEPTEFLMDLLEKFLTVKCGEFMYCILVPILA
jgi:hypothetical protein